MYPVLGIVLDTQLVFDTLMNWWVNEWNVEGMNKCHYPLQKGVSILGYIVLWAILGGFNFLTFSCFSLHICNIHCCDSFIKHSVACSFIGKYTYFLFYIFFNFLGLWYYRFSDIGNVRKSYLLAPYLADTICLYTPKGDAL